MYGIKKAIKASTKKALSYACTDAVGGSGEPQMASRKKEAVAVVVEVRSGEWRMGTVNGKRARGKGGFSFHFPLR